jgi:hypothetical protein
MPIPSSGSLGMDRINFEFNETSSNTAQVDLSDMSKYVGKSAGQTVGFADFRNKPEYIQYAESVTPSTSTYTVGSFDIGQPTPNRKLLIVLLRSGGFGTMNMTGSTITVNGSTVATTTLANTSVTSNYYSVRVLLTNSYVTSGTTATASVTTSSTRNGTQYVYVMPLYGMVGSTKVAVTNNDYTRPVDFDLGTVTKRGMFFGGVWHEYHAPGSTATWSTTFGTPTVWYSNESPGDLQWYRSLCYYDNRDQTTSSAALTAQFNSNDTTSKTDASAGFSCWISEE